MSGLLTFHGQTREIAMKGKMKREGNSLIVEGEFQISLTEFNVKRPALLFIPTDEAITSFSLTSILSPLIPS